MNVLSWSGGKDSTATLILARELDIKIDVAVISLPMFDISRKIYADYPEHIDWLFSKAIPTIEKWGTHVKVVSSDKDYLYWFKHIVTRSKVPERNGKMTGWVMGGACVMNSVKVKPIKDYLRSISVPYTSIAGICADEPIRLERMDKRNQRSILAENNMTTRQARALCEQYGLLSPNYTCGCCIRGCWFCPNATIHTFANLKKCHPELYNELRELNDKYKSQLVSQGFKYTMTFDELDRQVDIHNNQMTIWDIMEGL